MPSYDVTDASGAQPRYSSCSHLRSRLPIRPRSARSWARGSSASTRRSATSTASQRTRCSRTASRSVRASRSSSALPWLFPEFELAFSPTKTTTPMDAIPADIYWLDPRVQVRFELMPGRRVQPFVVVGGGAPIALSSKRHDAQLRRDRRGLRRRRRPRSTPTRASRSAPMRGSRSSPARTRRCSATRPSSTSASTSTSARSTPTADDRVAGQRAAAPIAMATASPTTKTSAPTGPKTSTASRTPTAVPTSTTTAITCSTSPTSARTQPETYNGFEDDDGCPDTVPPDVESLKGTIEGLIYADGETAVRDSAQKSIAEHREDHDGPPVDQGRADRPHRRSRSQSVRARPSPASRRPTSNRSRPSSRTVAPKPSARRSSPPASLRAASSSTASAPKIPSPTTPRAKGRLANRRVEIKLFVPRAKRRLLLAAEQAALLGLHVFAELGRELAQQLLLARRQLLRDLDLPLDHVVAAAAVADRAGCPGRGARSRRRAACRA